ncbi:type II toxin-antitoxin system HicB family antitoxin [Candidatus Woesearchaeota archaeon]|nr:type II toxin-antitoxin system HicB family antitoxin [Candidatus Woesearchaeota archaeon]
MGTSYPIIVERDEDGWLVAEAVGLPGCHTQAKTKGELLARMKEAIQAYLAEGGDPSSNEFISLEHVEV